MKPYGKKLCLAAGLFAAFIVWTAAVRTVDVRPIGPQNSSVGFAALNRFFHDLTGVHMTLYTLTDRLGLVPAGICTGFGALGLVQWIRRKSLLKVDRSLLALGSFYAAVMAAYLFFERFAVNYRPVLIGGRLEASYPSSTTLLVLCVMPTAVMQLRTRIPKPALRRRICAAMTVFALFMTLARLLSGVHWLTDIVGGILLSGALVSAYCSVAGTA